MPAKVGINLVARCARELENVFHLCTYVHSYPAAIVLEQTHAVANSGR